MCAKKTASTDSTQPTSSDWPGIPTAVCPTEICFDTPNGRQCFPNAGWPWADPRAVTFNGGKLHRFEMRRLQSLFNDSSRNRKKFRDAVIDDLCRNFLFDIKDAKTLKKMVGLVRESDMDPCDRPLRSLRKLRQKLINKDSSPVAVMLASVSCSSAMNSRNTIEAITGEEPVTSDDSGPATADVDSGLWGAGAGAGAGSAIPGVGTLAGGILGGIYGAAIGTIVHALDENDDAQASSPKDPFNSDMPSWLASPYHCVGSAPMLTAVTAGELHDQLVHFGLRYFKKVGATRSDVRWPSVSIFEELRLIPPNECLILEEIEKLGTVINQIDEDRLCEARKCAIRIKELYEKLCMERASPTSQILASIADDSAGLSIDYFLESSGEPDFAKGFWGADWSGAKTGGGIGAAAGAAVGGGAGGVGAVPGGAAGAAIGAVAGSAAKSFAWWADNQ